jgi:hypothetical protein
MELFAVFKVGTYRHECGGIFSSLELATEAAKALAAGERDEHHSYEIIPFELNERTPQSPVSSPNPHRAGNFWCGGELDEPDAVAEITRKGVVDYSPSRPIARNFEIVEPDKDAARIKS